MHPGEPILDEILRNHREGAEAFMVWCRNHGPAAKALMAHPRGLEWAGNHLYKEESGLEKHGQKKPS